MTAGRKRNRRDKIRIDDSFVEARPGYKVAYKDKNGNVTEFPLAVRGSTEHGILCPYCAEIHHHGIPDGHRVSHCIDKHPNDIGYVIKTLNGNWGVSR